MTVIICSGAWVLMTLAFLLDVGSSAATAKLARCGLAPSYGDYLPAPNPVAGVRSCMGVRIALTVACLRERVHRRRTLSME